MVKLFGNKTQLTVKELKATDANQRNSGEYVAKLQEIYDFRNRYHEKIGSAQAKVSELNSKLQKVNAAILMELSEDKNRELIEERKGIKNELEVYEAITNTDVTEIIKEKYHALQDNYKELHDKAINEYHTYLGEIDAEITSIQEQAQKAVDELTELKAQHAGSQVQGLESFIVESFRK